MPQNACRTSTWMLIQHKYTRDAPIQSTFPTRDSRVSNSCCVQLSSSSRRCHLNLGLLEVEENVVCGQNSCEDFFEPFQKLAKAKQSHVFLAMKEGGRKRHQRRNQLTIWVLPFLRARGLRAAGCIHGMALVVIRDGQSRRFNRDSGRDSGRDSDG